MGAAPSRFPHLLLLGGATCAAALLGCVRDPTGPAPANIAGQWIYHEQLADNVQHVFCSDTGVYTLVQDGAKFSGSFVQNGTCLTSGGPGTNDGRGAVTDGTVTGNDIQFTTGGVCGYAGVVSASRSDVHSGRGICTFDLNGFHFNFDIVWDAQRN